jgi:hypothetical protein
MCDSHTVSRGAGGPHYETGPDRDEEPHDDLVRGLGAERLVVDPVARSRGAGRGITEEVEEAAAVEDLARLVARAVRGRAPAQLDLGARVGEADRLERRRGDDFVVVAGRGGGLGEGGGGCGGRYEPVR